MAHFKQEGGTITWRDMLCETILFSTTSMGLLSTVHTLPFIWSFSWSIGWEIRNCNFMFVIYFPILYLSNGCLIQGLPMIEVIFIMWRRCELQSVSLSNKATSIITITVTMGSTAVEKNWWNLYPTMLRSSYDKGRPGTIYWFHLAEWQVIEWNSCQIIIFFMSLCVACMS